MSNKHYDNVRASVEQLLAKLEELHYEAAMMADTDGLRCAKRLNDAFVKASCELDKLTLTLKIASDQAPVSETKKFEGT